MATARDTVSGMHLATGFLALGAVRAMQDGIERGQALAALDRAHAIGQRRYAQIVQHKRDVQRAQAEADLSRLMRNRQRLHG